jgi:hypothetical protein
MHNSRIKSGSNKSIDQNKRLNFKLKENMESAFISILIKLSIHNL